MHWLKKFFGGIGGGIDKFFERLSSQPPASTFAEGQRALMVKLMAAAGMFFCLCAIGMVFIIWKGQWPVSLRGDQLNWLGIALVLFLTGSLGVIFALAIGGPVGKFSGKATKDGLEWTMDDKDDPPNTPAQTVEVKVAQGATATAPEEDQK